MYHKNLLYKITFRLNPKQYDKLCELAVVRHTSVSNLIRYIVAEYLRNY